MYNLKLTEGEQLFTERRSAIFRKEEYEYIHIGIVDSKGETWTTTELDEVNTAQVYNQYRVRHGILFPDEIQLLRDYYGLSAAKMSEILGFGVNQYRYYENGEIPSVSNARILMSIKNKQIFLDYLDASIQMIGSEEFKKIRKKIISLPEFSRSESKRSSLTGYAKYSPEKVSSAVKYFINEIGGVFVTKMNKLLFYTDFLCYRRKGFGLTGLEYLALQFGPVPDNWARVYNSISGIRMEEYIFQDMNSGIELNTEDKPDMSLFDSVEKDTLKDVANRFRKAKAGEISQVSHNERGWKENQEKRNAIDYSYAFELSII